MYYKFILIISLGLFFSFSCEEAKEAVVCTDATLDLVSASSTFNDSQTSDNCIALQSAASYYLSNNCSDTSGFGGADPAFIVDSLNCDLLPS